MSIPNNISKEHLLKAIAKVDKDGIPKDGDSQFYDVVYEGKRYPPKILVSYANIFANGKELDRNSFSAGVGKESFKLLEREGFRIEKKSEVKKIILYDIHGSSAIENYKTLLTDDKKYFYWDDGKFKKYQEGEYVFWINRVERIALFSIIENINISPSFNNGKNIISNLGYNLSANAEDANRFKNFIRFKIADYVSISKEWNYTDPSTFQTQGMSYKLFEEGISDVEKRVSKLRDLLKINFKDDTKKILSDAILALEHEFTSPVLIKDSNSTKVWFVAQGSTFREDRGMKFLWAPEMGKRNRSKFYWENVLKVRKGDIIFHYSDKELKGISEAINDGYIADNPETISVWGKKGYKVDVDITLLSPAISSSELRKHHEEFRKYLATISNKPFDLVGDVNQGYLYEFNKEAGRLIRDLYGKNFGSKIIDDFFDTVDLKKTLKSDFMDFNSKTFYESCASANLFISQDICSCFVAALLAKPFVILTGLSGSGKTKLAQAFATWICENDDQYCIVPVGADWTNREPLLGFPNALKDNEYIKPDNKVLDLLIDANNSPDKPYFLILDEMNLSHVERYFADFLSVMESNSKIYLHSGNDNWNVPSKLELSKNLFIIGTVNIDETTYMFSPKVLDRANVIEFRVTDEEMGRYFQKNTTLNMKALSKLGSNMAVNFVEFAKKNNYESRYTNDLQNAFMGFFVELKKVGAEFGYRSASEIFRFTSIVLQLEPNWSLTKIIDAAVMQKLLPKVHGSRRKLEPILKALGSLCLNNEMKFEEYLKGANTIDVKYPVSLEKIRRMYENLISNGFTSYAEA